MAPFQLLMINAAAVAVAMLLLWLLSLWVRDASVVDIFWGIGFVLIAGITFALSDRGLRATILTVLTSVWGIRLAGYLGWRNIGKGEDKRYQEMREHHGDKFWWVSLFTVYGLQGAVMWLVSLPVQVGQMVGSPMGSLNHLGVAVWGLGFLFESVGDFQLARFKANASNQGKVMDRGLWRYTRHPNYFGNSLIWWGLFLIAVTTPTIWIVVSPAVMTFLLLKVSGVAMLERSLKSRSPEYCDYVDRTSAFIPWPPKASGG